jgi:2,3,4,5-tetrahydropyridine-2,6-dicarboxylate N-succinyltransferase
MFRVERSEYGMTYLAEPVWGHGLATLTEEGRVLDVWYPTGHLGIGADDPAKGFEQLSHRSHGFKRVPVRTRISSLAAPPADITDAYLRLHLLSHRLVQPHQANLDGLLSLLSHNAWTSAGPCRPDRLEELRWAELASGRHLSIYGVDFFPRMTDYVVPGGVRIASADRVRLGAYLAPGTTVLQEGFVGFNAGTLGRCMVEGRITAGTVVGDGSDIGGGASIMGTISGGGEHVVTIGERCLIGANGGVGISLGDDCVVEAGCYVTASSKITLPDGRVLKGIELSGTNGMRYWRNSTTGVLEATPRRGPGVMLNPAVHLE